MLEKLGGRKFIYTIISVTFAFVLVLVKCLSAQEWLKFVELVGATYIASNVVSKFADKKVD